MKIRANFHSLFPNVFHIKKDKKITEQNLLSIWNQPVQRRFVPIAVQPQTLSMGNDTARIFQTSHF